ncbi:hypothetical protein [Rhodococcus ruber]|uniref:hypothetical protein n=1 Tax=Rhodococcus ruber TaxID=1830 RepID=UPI003D816D6D
MSARPLELDGVEWDVAAFPPLTGPARSLPGSLTRGQVLRQLGVSGLLGVAARACSDSDSAAREMLRTEFGMSSERARKAVQLGTRLTTDRDVNNHPLGYLAGITLSRSQARRVLALCDAQTQNAGAAATKVSLDRIQKSWGNRHLDKIVRAAASSADLVTAVVTAGLLTSMHSPTEAPAAQILSESLAQSIAFDQPATERQRRSDRIVAAAYALAALRSPGLDLGDGALWDDGTVGWRFRAAPWLLPTVDPLDSTPVRRLLDAALKRTLDFVPVGASPFGYSEEIEYDALDTQVVRARTLAEAGQLTKYSETPMWFDGGDDGQVLLTMGAGHGYAWVGRHNHGVLVAFDLEYLTGYGLDEPGVRAALAMAIGWFVDVSVRLLEAPAGTNHFTRHGGNKTAGYRYLPRPTFGENVRRVAEGHHSPPRPHVVRAHIRTLPEDHNPSPEARARAPRHLRTRMGPQDTYVRQHWKSDASPADLANRLSKHSQLADIIGELQRGTDAAG